MLDVSNGHQLNITLFDEDSFSRDNFLGFISYKVNEMPVGESLVTTLELQNDERENDSKDPTEVSGVVTFQLELLNLTSEVMDNPRFFVFNIFIYSFNNVIDDINIETYPSTKLIVEVGDKCLYR